MNALLIKNADVYAPEPLGVQDILCCEGRISKIGAINAEDVRTVFEKVQVIDAQGAKIIPGLVDGHVHIGGGGGEGGFAYRVPPVQVSTLVSAGITTVVGLLGTDGFCRRLEETLGKARALTEEGLSAALFTGAYQFPGPSLTGDQARDIMLIPEVIGIKVALSDHRSSHMTVQDLRALISSARVAGLLTGKAGLVCIHMGDEPAGLTPLMEAFEGTGIPLCHALPTHVGRNERLTEQAAHWTKKGGYVDFTAGPEAWKALQRFLQKGGDLTHITLSSDGNGSMPQFDQEGKLKGMGVGSPASLLTTLKACIDHSVTSFESLLPALTAAPAQLLGLKNKGRLQVGYDADMVILDDKLKVRQLWAKGEGFVNDGQVVRGGTYEHF